MDLARGKTQERCVLGISFIALSCACCTAIQNVWCNAGLMPTTVGNIIYLIGCVYGGLVFISDGVICCTFIPVSLCTITYWLRKSW